MIPSCWLRLMNQVTGAVARVEVSRENENLVERRILANDFAALGEWEAFTLHFDVEGELIEGPIVIAPAREHILMIDTNAVAVTGKVSIRSIVVIDKGSGEHHGSQ